MDANEQVLPAAISPRLAAAFADWPIEHSEELLAIVGDGGRLAHVSPAWGRILGWTREQLEQRTLLDLVHVDDLHRAVAETAQRGR